MLSNWYITQQITDIRQRELRQAALARRQWLETQPAAARKSVQPGRLIAALVLLVRHYTISRRLPRKLAAA